MFLFCSCKSPSSGVLITHCTRCWDSRKQWAPERPRRKRRAKKEKAKVTTLVVPEGMDDTDGGSTVEGEIDRPRSDTMSSQDSGIGSQEFEMLELTETEVVAPPTSLDLTKLGRSISLDTTSMSSSSSTSGSMTMDTSELSELGSMSDMKAMSRGAEMCMFCEMRPRNAIFIHGKLGHQVGQDKDSFEQFFLLKITSFKIKMNLNTGMLLSVCQKELEDLPKLPNMQTTS